MLPGQTAAGVNITNYTRGINGLIVTLDGAAGDGIGADDFRFKVGTGADPSAWADAPSPLNVTATNLENGRTRIVVTWADGLIKNAWLQTTVLANADTRLAARQVNFRAQPVDDDIRRDKRVSHPRDLVADRGKIDGDLVGKRPLELALDCRRAFYRHPRFVDAPGILHVPDVA